MSISQNSRLLVTCVLILWFFSASAEAQSPPQVAAPPAIGHYFSVHPVPFAATGRGKARVNRAVVHPAANGATPASAAPEIVELARALQNDPDLIYEYVHDKIEFSALWGLLKGPVGTILDGRGNAFDQSALLVALLNQASINNPAISNPTFEFGQIHLTSGQVDAWLNIDSNQDTLSGIMAGGGIPGTVYSDGSADIGHVWVKVTINGSSCIFDPAFKSHSWKAGIVDQLPQIMGYTKAQFIADANPTVTGTPVDTITNIKRTQLRTDLTQYATALDTYIRKTLPNAGVKDVLGGGDIVPTPFVNGVTVRQASNPYQVGAPTEWTSIPDEFHTTLSVSLPGASETPVFTSDDLYGHRLTIFFDASYVPTLYADGNVVVKGKAQTAGSSVQISFEIVTAPEVPGGTPFFTESGAQYIAAQTNANGGGYAIVNGFDQVGRGTIEKHKNLLNLALAQGSATNSEVVLGESLMLNGVTWLAECAQEQQIADRLLGTYTQFVFGVGISGEAVGSTVVSPYVDLPFLFIDTPTRFNGAQTETANSVAAFVEAAGVASIFESASLEETQAQISGFSAASTTKLLDMAIQNNDPIEDIDASNWAAKQALMKPNYNLADLSAIGCWINGQPLPSAKPCTTQLPGFRVIAPLHGKIAVGKWTGVGYEAMGATNGVSVISEEISGGLSGGFGGFEDDPQTFVGNILSSVAQPSLSITTSAGCYYLCGVGVSPSGNGLTSVGDPIDHTKGSYQYQHVDLAVGPKDFPYGLALKRSYDSGARSLVSSFGQGWTSDYYVTAAADSDPFAGMGGSTLLSAADSIAALVVSSDLVSGQQPIPGAGNLEYFALEAITNRWFADRLTQNVVNVTKGWSSEQFTLLSDGTYANPLGTASSLDKVAGNFRYRTTTGDTLNFNSSGQVVSWSNAAGAAAAFSYSGGQLSRVTSATNRYLSFIYTNGLVSSVSDGTRTVKYSYLPNIELGTFTDAISNPTTYTYVYFSGTGLGGFLSQIFYPSNPANAFVTNTYDSLGRVMQQKDADGNVTNAYFSGTRSEIDDPSGMRHVWNLDALGNVLSEVQDAGAAPHLNQTTINSYDGQNNLISTVMPEGNSVNYTYDAYKNPLTITRVPKPGSSLAQRVTTLAYIAPISTFPSFEEVKTATDPNGNVTTCSYDSSTGTLLKVDQPAVPKPGLASNVDPEQTYTYTANGLRQTGQDAEGRVTRYDYDSAHPDQIVKMTVDYGGLNLLTQYAYDAVGNVTTIIDPNSHSTTRKYDNLRRVIEEDAPISGVVTKKSYYPNGPVKTVARQLDANTSETTSYTYTLSDQMSVVTDPLGSTTTTTYDANDRVQTVTQQVSATQNRQRTYSYDALGRQYQVTDTSTASAPIVLETHTYTLNGKDASFSDANSNVIGYVYDGFDELEHTAYPDHSTEAYQYDKNGNVLQKTTRSLQTIGFTYDALNRVSTKTPQGEIAGQVTYGYDLTGRLLQASDGSSAQPYVIGYDTAGRATSYTDQQGHQMQTQHDSAGNRTRLQWPAGTNGSASYFATFQFDPMNRLTGVLQNGQTPLASYSWDALSRLMLISYGDGTSDEYSKYDAGDNLQTLTQTFPGAGSSVTFTYGWQKNHQRSSTSVTNSAFQYAPLAGTINFGLADVNNGYTTASTVNGNFTFLYDGNLNLTADGFNASVFDVENRLIQTQSLTGGNTTFLYDPLGHRKQKQTGSIVRQFLLADGQEVADYDGSGVGAPWLLTVPGIGGMPLASFVPSKGWITYYHRDVLGSTVAATMSGSTAQPYVYDEFGKTVTGSGLPYQFAGYRFDDETGLYYVGARYYSPSLGRFLQPDPVGSSVGANLYAYVGNDPINVTDPSGKCPWCIAADAAIGGVGGAISGGITGYKATETWQGATAGAFSGGVLGAITGALSPGAAFASAEGAVALISYNMSTSAFNSVVGDRIRYWSVGGTVPDDSDNAFQGLASGLAQSGFGLAPSVSNLGDRLLNANAAVLGDMWTLGASNRSSQNGFTGTTPK